MWNRYRDWMYAWETRLNARDKNRVVRPLEWGLDWTEHWPVVNGTREASPVNPAAYVTQLNRQIVSRSDGFYAYRTPSDFRLQGGFLLFTSPVQTPYAVNNLARARWFPAGRRRALIVLPQWNADAEGHNGLCWIFNRLGISALRLSLPYHDYRKPAETERADYAVSANIGRTIDAGRQAVIDARSCLDWLEMQGYTELGIVGTSLGSCYAFLTSSHDSRLRVNIFNHFSVTFGDVVWTGQSTRHVRQGVEGDIDQETLRRAMMAISPISYVDKYARWPKKSLLIHAAFDLTFLPVYSHQFLDEFARRGLPHRSAVLPCGHYTTAETPFKYLDAYYMASFLRSAFE
ncbi:MAG: alpha/beta hydrolase family protein [Terriglobia bacterium]